MAKNWREEEKEEGSSGAFKAIGAMAGLAVGVWGIYSMVSSSGTKKEEVMVKSVSSRWEEEEAGDEDNYNYEDEEADRHVTFQATTPPPMKISWSPPQKGWDKLNTDASVKPNLSSVGIGGLLRNYKGEWIWGFTGKSDIDSLDITEAELTAMKEGLVIAREKNLSQIVVEIDSEPAFKLIQKKDPPKDPRLLPLIQDCQKLLAEPGTSYLLQFTPKKGNQSADFLSKQGHDEEVLGVRFLLKPLPGRLTEILKKDRMCN